MSSMQVSTSNGPACWNHHLVIGHFTAVLERLFAQKQGDVKRCWETAAPGLKGRWRLSVELQLDGSLSKVSFEPEQGVLDTGFQTCVVNKASRWTVTEKTDTVTSYSQPFTF